MSTESARHAIETEDHRPDSGPLATDAGQRLLDLISGFHASQTVRAIAELSVADHLHHGALSADEVAAREGSDAGAMFRLMRAGVALGLLTADADGTFGGTALLDLLRTEAPCSLRPLALMFTSRANWMTWTGLTAAVRSGQSQTSAVLGTDFFSYLLQNPADGYDFAAASTSATLYWAESAAQVIDTTDVQRAVDVGAAHGGLLRLLQQSNPALRGVIFDQPDVLENARAEVAQAGFPDRTEFFGGDFFASVPPGDLYLLKFILHDWTDQQSIEILRRCREAMLPGGRIMVIEFLIGKTSAPAKMATFLDMTMLLMLPGRERSLEELDSLFAAAGLRRVSVKPLRHPQVVIEAVAT
jgi:ubiquinone/menaquinone biosynthesis C-methylase UbiE